VAADLADEEAEEELERFRRLAERGYLRSDELERRQTAIRAAVGAGAGEFTADSLSAADLGELAARLEQGALSRALFEACKQDYLWQPADGGPPARTVFELRESVQAVPVTLAKGLAVNLASALLGGGAEPVARSTSLGIVERSSGAVLWRVRGITLRSELETWRDRIQQDLRALSVEDFRRRYRRHRGPQADDAAG